MYAAVDSREVRHKNEILVIFPFLLPFSIHTINLSALFATSGQKYKWMSASNYTVKQESLEY